MTPNIQKELAKEHSQFHDDLLAKLKKKVKLSRDVMVKMYSKWDKYDAIYRGLVNRDEKDKMAAERGEPEKLVMPLTFSQINTFIAFCYTLYTQREYFYELNGTGIEDSPAAATGEALLERDLKKSNFKGDKLYQFLLDIARFGIGIFKHTWQVETSMVETVAPMQMDDVLGMQGPMQQVTQMVEKTVFMGNRIVCVSPYRFFPDPSLPVCRFQEGEYCASEEEFAYHTLKKLSYQGLIYGLEFVKPLEKESLDNRRLSFNYQDYTNSNKYVQEVKERPYVLTEVQINIIPSEFKINDEPLGEEEYPVKYVAWYLNDSRLVRFEPMGYLHDQFTFDAAQFSPDQMVTINHGISELLEGLQDLYTWLYNARVTSVRKTINNQAIVDPSGIEMQDLKDRNPIIRLKKDNYGSDVRRYYFPIPVQDVTQSHLTDAEVVEAAAKNATGITENLMGQFASGRRSATEAHSVNSNATGRLKMVASSIWETALRPLGEKMLSNLRDGLDVPQIVKVTGEVNAIDPMTGMLKPSVSSFMPVDKTKLIGNYDFEVYDGTLPSEKGFAANALQEFLMTMLQNPQASALFGYNPVPMMQRIFELRGIKNTDEFKLPPEITAQLQQKFMQDMINGGINGNGNTNPQGQGNPPSQPGKPVPQ